MGEINAVVLSCCHAADCGFRPYSAGFEVAAIYFVAEKLILLARSETPGDALCQKTIEVERKRGMDSYLNKNNWTGSTRWSG